MKNINFLPILFLILVVFSCKSKEGAAIEAKPAGTTAATPKGKKYVTSLGMSDIRWSGSSPGRSHEGTIQVSKGELFFEKGNFAGSFIIDMNSIEVKDLEGKEKITLESHLKGTGDEGASDFFNVRKYPTAKFDIIEIVGSSDQPNANATIGGNLTMCGVTKLVSFPGLINVTDEDITLSTNPFTINRTDWGIKYGSKTFFQNLKDEFIDDNITLRVSLRCIAYKGQ
jgi:polyisoprenoid-binding protein YceI